MDVEPALLRDVEVLVGTSHRAVEVLDLENGMPTVLRAISAMMCALGRKVSS